MTNFKKVVSAVIPFTITTMMILAVKMCLSELHDSTSFSSTDAMMLSGVLFVKLFTLAVFLFYQKDRGRQILLFSFISSDILGLILITEETAAICWMLIILFLQIGTVTISMSEKKRKRTWREATKETGSSESSEKFWMVSAKRPFKSHTLIWEEEAL